MAKQQHGAIEIYGDITGITIDGFIIKGVDIGLAIGNYDEADTYTIINNTFQEFESWFYEGPVDEDIKTDNDFVPGTTLYTEDFNGDTVMVLFNDDHYDDTILMLINEAFSPDSMMQRLFHYDAETYMIDLDTFEVYDEDKYPNVEEALYGYLVEAEDFDTHEELEYAFNQRVQYLKEGDTDE